MQSIIPADLQYVFFIEFFYIEGIGVHNKFTLLF